MARQGPTEVELRVSDLNGEGLGISQHNEREVQIRNALPGEHVRARILKRRKGVRFADGIDVLEDHHAHRVDPRCEYFPRCAGCSLQHMRYEHQLEHKQGQVRAELERVGIQPETWRAPTSRVELGYRRKARLGVRVVGEQVLVGFRESFSNRVSRMDSCQTLSENLSRLIAPLKMTVSLCHQPNTIPQIELAEGDDGVVVIVRHLEALSRDDIKHWQAFENDTGAAVLLQPKGYDSVHPVNVSPSSASEVPQLSYELEKLTMTFDPRQFTQVNAAMNQVLVSQALQFLHPLEGKQVLDLFCGIGNFSLPIAKEGACVWGVEFAEEAVRQAELNARSNQIENSHFLCSNLYESAEFLDPRTQDATALVLDPPRSGAGPLLASWLDKLTKLVEIVYISCKPKTFAEDVQIMAQYGFRLVEVGAYDMFPQTSHIETIGYLKRG